MGVGTARSLDLIRIAQIRYKNPISVYMPNTVRLLVDRGGWRISRKKGKTLKERGFIRLLYANHVYELL
jgi:hypothetical protein